MTEQQIMSFIEVTAENTALKIEKKIGESILSHERNCANQFNGRMELLENAVISFSQKSKTQFDQFGPIIAVIFKNWKALMVVAALFLGMASNFKSGKPYTIEELKQVIKQVQTADAEPAADSQKEKKQTL